MTSLIFKLNNMKKFVFAVALISQFIFSQDATDKILKVEYDEYRIFRQGFINLDLGTLLVSDDYSYYSSNVQKKITDNSVPDVNAIMFKAGKDNVEILPEIIIDRKQSLLTERLYDDLQLMNYYAVIEPLPKMKWKLSTEQKVIGKYNCKKATVEFRGRTYEAWYTLQIPISLGPWKFNGLPGIILAVEDQTGIYKWQARLVSYKNNITKKELLVKTASDSKFENISFQNYDAKRVQKAQNKIQTIKARNGARGMQFGMTTTFESDKEPQNEFRTEMIFK